MLEIPADGDYDRDEAERADLVGLHLAGSRPPLLLVRTWHGEIEHERGLARLLGPEQPIVSVGPPRGKAVEDFPADAHAWADLALARLLPLTGSSPRRIGGWSFGGVIAYEVATRLACSGRAVDLVAMLDTRVPSQQPPPRERRRRSAVHKMVRSLDHVLEEPTWRRRLAYVWSRQQRRGRKLAARAQRAKEWWRGQEPALHPDVHPGDAIFVTPTGQRISLLQRTIWVSYRKYRPAPSSLPVLLLRTAESQAATGASLGWEPYLHGDLESAIVPGDHFTMFDEPHLPALARRLAAALAQTEREPRPLAHEASEPRALAG